MPRPTSQESFDFDNISSSDDEGPAPPPAAAPAPGPVPERVINPVVKPDGKSNRALDVDLLFERGTPTGSICKYCR